MLDPVGKWRDELSMASLMALLVNIARKILHDPKKGKIEFVSPDDFMIKWGELKTEQKQEPKVQTVEEMKQTVLSIARYFGTKEKKK